MSFIAYKQILYYWFFITGIAQQLGLQLWDSLLAKFPLMMGSITNNSFPLGSSLCFSTKIL